MTECIYCGGFTRPGNEMCEECLQDFQECLEVSRDCCCQYCGRLLYSGETCWECMDEASDYSWQEYPLSSDEYQAEVDWYANHYPELDPPPEMTTDVRVAYSGWVLYRLISRLLVFLRLKTEPPL